jgi:ABC-2 type transport system permease protein
VNFLYRMWLERPRIINNPILKREAIDRLRKISSFWYLGALLVCTFVILLYRWNEALSEYNVFSIIDSSRNIFIFLLSIQGTLVFLITPLISATSINLEYEQNSWELLISSPMNIASIIIAKWLSSLIYIWFLLISLIPVYGICFLLGGVSPEEIGFAFLMFSEGVLIVSGIGLYCSIIWKRTIQSISGTYMLSFIYLLVLPFFGDSILMELHGLCHLVQSRYTYFSSTNYLPI